MSKVRSSASVRYAVVGGGPFTQRRVLPAFERTRNSELCALIAADEQKRTAAARGYGLELTGGMDDLERLLEQSRAQAIYLCAPSAQHRSLTERAARVGVHVLCDTPMAETVEDCRAMLGCCKAARVLLMVAYRLHFDEANQDAVALVRGGRLGTPRILASLLTRLASKGARDVPAKIAGAVLRDLATYPIHAARQLFGAEPTRVVATTARTDPRGTEASPALSAILNFEDQGCAQFTVSLAASGVDSYQLIGEKGNLTLEPAYACDESREHVLSIGDHRVERRFPHRDQLAEQISAFSRAILGQADIAPDGNEGLADVRVLQALRESVRLGRSVELARCAQFGRVLAG